MPTPIEQKKQSSNSSPIHYEESCKAKAIGIFSGFAKSRVVLNDSNDTIVKIAAVKINDLNKPVTTTFFFKTHVRVKIGEDSYDVNISSLAKRLGITKQKAEELLTQSGSLTETLDLLKRNLSNLSSQINKFYLGDLENNNSKNVSQVIDFLIENKEKLTKSANEDKSISYQVGDFTIEVSKKTIKLTKGKFTAPLFLDPNNPLNVKIIDAQYFEAIFKVLKDLNTSNQELCLIDLRQLIGDKSFLEFATYCAEKETPLQSTESLFREKSITISIYRTLMNGVIGQQLQDAIGNLFIEYPILNIKKPNDGQKDKYNHAANTGLPIFFDKLNDIVTKLPPEIKHYHIMLRDNLTKLFRSKGSELEKTNPEKRANEIILTFLFLRMICPIFCNSGNTGVAALLQKLANQVTGGKSNDWSFFDETIQSMQRKGKYSTYLKNLLGL
jgi:hypothetical protein